jgi:drug/metabolite transporter (DMT)-like permease
MKLKEWGAFALLGLVWGSSFLWIKIAIQEIGPFTLVAFRLLFGLVGLLVIMRLQKQSFPRDRRVLLAYLFMGTFNTAIPFTLISWGETRIDSGLASILNGTVPLFTIVIAHFWLHDEKITLPRIAGLLVGFVGVVVLVSRDIGPQGLVGNLWGQVAVIGGSVCYAVAITFSRKHLRNQPPVLQSTMILLVADALLWLSVPIVRRVAPGIESPLHVIPVLPLTWFAIAWLGLLGSCLAYLLFFYLINSWGPTRASLVTYVFPVIGLVLGIIFLKEVVDWQLVVGPLLVVAGIVVVNFIRRPQSVQAATTTTAAAAD